MSKRFRILFYKPAIDGKWIDNGIASWTRFLNLDAPKKLICSHEEIWVDDSQVFGKTDWICGFQGTTYSSTMGQIRSKDTVGSGARKAPACEILHNPERWFYAEFEVSDFGYKEMLTMMEVELDSNKGYDKWMILNFFLPLGIGEKDKWICSEFVNHHALIAFRYSKLFSDNPVVYKDNPTYQIAVKKIIDDTMSPLRTAKRLWQYGVSFYNLDGSLLSSGGNKN
jgi:hypothetical protein